jgi:phosphohistidine phosphatase
MKRLLLLRHAKAVQANKDTPADAERPLAERGRKDAPRVGRALREKGYMPGLVLCSPSRRTRETFELGNAELHSDAKIEFVDALYAASAKRIVALLRTLPDKAEQPLLVGHNPGLEDCVLLLTTRDANSALQKSLEAMEEKFPTCAVAVLDFPMRTWKSITPHSAKLVDFIRPKDLDAR